MEDILQQSIISKPVSHSDRNTTTGQFVKGNRAAVGRSSSCRNNLQVLRCVVSAEDVAALAEILKTKAMNGDLSAIKILLDLCLPPVSLRLAVDDRHEREEEAERVREALANPRHKLP